jgi:hypothetical protein
MAQNSIGRLVVVSDDDPAEPIGFLARSDLLTARARLVEEEQRRERFIGRNRLRPKPAKSPEESVGQSGPVAGDLRAPAERPGCLIPKLASHFRCMKSPRQWDVIHALYLS